MSGLPPKKVPPPPPGAINRRRAERYDLIAQIELRHSGEVIVLSVANISAGGVFLINEREIGLKNLQVGEQLGVFLSIEGEDDLAFAMEAEVMRIEAGGPGRPLGVALMWTSSDPVQVTALARVLARVAPH